MVERFTQGKLLWINLKNPNSDEVKRVMDELELSPLLMADLTTPVPKNYALKIDTAIKITLDFPVIKRIDVEHPYEIKFIVSKHSLLTVQYEEMSAIDRFKRQFEVAATLRRTQKNITGAHLFVSLMNNLYESASIKLDYIESKLADIESDIFENNEKEMVFNISNTSKKLISFRHVVRSHEDVFRDARVLFEEMYGALFAQDLQNLQGQYFILLRRTNTLFETLTALRETNIAMLSTKENEIIKTLTIMAFVTYPLTLLSSMFGMNVSNAPIIGRDGDFWVIVGIMCIATLGFFVYFRHKGWM
jgi:magnesium transporter